MPTAEDLAEFFTRHYPEPGMLFDGHVARLDDIVRGLREGPFAQHVRIFGSAIVPDVLPSDIDAFVDLSGIDDTMTIVQGEAHLLGMARFYANQGAFDPFVLHCNKRLDCRNSYGTAWTTAKGAAKLTKAGKAGIPLSEFTRVFSEEFSYAKTRPDPKAPAF